VIIAAGMKAASSVVNLVLLAVLVAQSLSPVLFWLMDRGFSRSFSVLATILAVIVGGVVLVFLLANSLSQLNARMPAYEEHIAGAQENFTNFLREHDLSTTQVLSLRTMEPRQAARFTGKLVGRAGQAMGNGFVMLLIVVFTLIEMAAARERRARHAVDSPGAMDKTLDYVRGVGKFIAITGWIGLLTAVANFILMLILGIDFALIWAVLSFFLNFIPALGFLISVIPPVLLGFLESGWPTALGVFVGFLVINTIADNVIKPRFVQQTLNIPPIVLIISLVFWLWVLGPPGAILAVPLTMTIRRISQELVSGEGPAAGGPPLSSAC
jgi:predicted PurR-regulated permease PerM